MNGCPDCAKMTAGFCQRHLPTAYEPFGTSVPLMLPQQHGWICPRCQQVNAPWVPNCACKPAEARDDA